MADLVERYADLRLGGTDASDRRHVTVVRPVHLVAFALLPEVMSS